jgi:hypothetical protein
MPSASEKLLSLRTVRWPGAFTRRMRRIQGPSNQQHALERGEGGVAASETEGIDHLLRLPSEQ